MSNLMMNGLELMLLGMGTVFVFLTVLVIGHFPDVASGYAGAGDPRT